MQKTERSPLAIGVDIGGTRTKTGLVDIGSGQVLDLCVEPTETRDAHRFEQSLGRAIEHVKAKAGIHDTDVRGIGIGVSSFVFADGRVDSTYGFMPFLDDYPLADRIAQTYNLPCRVENDARLVALGEALYGAGRGYERVLVLTLGTGLGVGLVIDGKLDGQLPYAHMAGHITVTQNDYPCYCGKTGCLESLVSATGLVAAATRSGWQPAGPNAAVTAETIFRAGETADAQALELVTHLVGHLKTGIDNYTNLFAPDRIVLGGGVAKGLATYLPFLNHSKQVGPYQRYSRSLALSELAEKAGVLGSAALFR